MLDKGDKIGDYTLVRFLGRGQFGVVWLAEKEIQFSERKVRHALKFLSGFGDEITEKTVQAEIDTWIEASGHPNVMSVLDMLTHDHHIVIASEYADGGSMMGWLKKSGGKAPSQEKALEMMNGILSGIEHLHTRNVVHRDLKPDNILLQGNCPRITDFGISRIVSAGSMSAVAMGSPFYMSPESFEGSKVTQTDIWSAGVIFYEMLSGGHPYSSDSMFGLVRSIRQDQPKPLPDEIPFELRQVVDNALQKDPSKRFQTAEQMRLAIDTAAYDLKARSNNYPSSDAFLNVPGYIDAAAPTLVNVNSEEIKAAITSQEEIDQKAAAEPAQAPAEKIAVEPPIKKISAKPPTVATNYEQPRETSANADAEPPKAAPVDPGFAVEVPSPDSPEMQTVTNRSIAAAMQPPISGSGEQFVTSQSVRSRKQLIVIAGIAAAVTFGIIIVIAAFVIVSRAVYVSVTDDANSVAANTTNANSQPPKPDPPEDMVYIEGGEFMMGRDNLEIVEEKPAHAVRVLPFFMDIYEVTNEKYALFVKDTQHKAPPGWKNNTYRDGKGKLPVVGVNWDDANTYATWAGKRLPTEEEWEFAARGKEGFLYPWGNQWKAGLANVAGASRSFAAVGTYKGSSPFGIYDMVGNAGEWTSNDFKAYPNGRLSDVYIEMSNLKTLRGNNFRGTRNFANATYRAGWPTTGAETYRTTGFRCAKDIDR